MILVDFNQLLIAKIAQLSSEGSIDINKKLIRRVVLNSIKNSTRQFREEYGKPVICYDGRKSWRKEAFPFYKHQRKESRSADTKVNWPLVFDCSLQVREELTGVLPYKVVCVEGAEADDIIAVLTKKKATHF
jgi:5'-3' exonuclease